MKTTKAVFGILSITAALAVLTTGCSRNENAGLKEYHFEGLADSHAQFVKGLPGFYSDYTTHTHDTNFTLPNQAIYYDNYYAWKFLTDGIYNPKTNSGEVPYSALWLTEFYWDVHFLGTAQVWDVRSVRGAEQKFEMLSFRFRANNKKTPTEIQVFEALSSILHKKVSEITSDSIDKQASATLIKQFGEPLMNTFIGKLSHSRKVALMTMHDAATRYFENRPAIAASRDSNGSDSVSSSGAPHKSARQLIMDRAKSTRGRNADVDIQGGFYGGAYQVTVSDHENFHTYTYAVEVNEKAQKITAWQLTASN